MLNLTGKQELALAIAKSAVGDWKAEEARAHDGIALSKRNAVVCLKKATKAGVSQSDLAEALGLSRQRVHQLVTTGR